MHRLAATEADYQAAGLVILTLTLALVVSGLASAALAQTPGPELFAKEPRTPGELWDAIDYLLRTNQAKKALPYLDKFMKSKPDDATLIAIRNRYGPGSILRLSDDAATRPFAEPLAAAMVAAARKYATRPERIARFVSELTKTPEEQDYAVRHLREAGPDAVPFLAEALSQPDLSAIDRRLIVHNMGRLDRSVIPALVTVLDSPDPVLAADAATALGMIGYNEATPYLTFPAASPEAAPGVRAAAQAAIGRLTGQPFFTQPHTSAQALTAMAWRYHRHQVEFPGGTVVVWAWDNDRRAPVPREVPRTEAEAILGGRFVHQALQLDPNNRDAQVAQLSLMLDKAIERVGFSAFPAKDQATFTTARASSPVILSQVLKTAIEDHKYDLAAVVAALLGQVSDRKALTAASRPHPLVDALYAPGRRVQFAAAKALMTLMPTEPFPGSSRVVPTLARFIVNQTLPRAVVIDSNPNRGSQLAGFLITLGYDSELEQTGDHGFRAAAESTDVELILISYDLFQPGWRLNDTLANLGADSRTAAIPVFIYGPLDVQYKRPSLEHDYPGIKFLVQPVDALTLLRQLKGLPAPLTEVERAGYARESAALLAGIATQRKGPLTADLIAAEPALAVALGAAETASAAITALGGVPDPDAQRSLANLVLDPSKAPDIRRLTAAQLVRSIQRFGRLVSADHEARLARSLREETDPDVRADLITLLRVLLPSPPASLPQPPAPPVPATAPAPMHAPATMPTTSPQPGAHS
jgi:HEAT repeat protein